MSQARSVNLRKHLPALDAVRGVAILGVFCYHILSSVWGHDQIEWGNRFRQFSQAPHGFIWFYPLTFGWVGVSLFFVLSGFVIHYSTVTSSQPFSTLNFYSRRFWRIYPPYAVAMLVLAPLVYYLISPEKVTHISIVTHILLVQDFSRQSFYLINGSFWSIATEVQFYLVYPLLMLARGRVGMRNVLFGTLGFSLAFRALLCVAKRHDAASFEDSHLILWASPMITIFDWTLGAFIAERFAQGKRIFPESFALMTVTAGLFLVSTFIRPLSIFSFQFASLLAALWIERVVWSTRPLSLVKKMLIPLGLCSYSFYLFHQPLLEILIEKSKPWISTNPMTIALVCGPILFFALFGLSWTIYLAVEKPSMQLGKRFSIGARKIDVKRVDSAPSGKALGMESEIAAGNLADLRVASESTP